MSKTTDQKQMIRTVGNILLLTAVCMIVFCIWQLLRIFLNYSISEGEYDDVRKNAIYQEEDSNRLDSTWGYTPGRPLRIDFDKLKKLNPEIIAWIYIPGLKISYPVMHTGDNNKYLHTTYRGTYAYAGSIFMDCDNDPDFYDRHTIIYGHNMNNGTMFGRLRRCIDFANPPFSSMRSRMSKTSKMSSTATGRRKSSASSSQDPTRTC